MTWLKFKFKPENSERARDKHDSAKNGSILPGCVPLTQTRPDKGTKEASVSKVAFEIGKPCICDVSAISI